MELPVTLDYELTPENFADLMTVGQQKSFGKARLLFGYTLPLLGAAATGAGASYVEGFGLDKGLFFGFLAYAVGWIISYRIFCIPHSQLIDPSGVLLGKAKLLATANAVEVTTSRSFWRMNWSGFVDVVEANSSVLLFIDRMQAIVVDKGAFASEAEQTEFLELTSSLLARAKDN